MAWRRKIDTLGIFGYGKIGRLLADYAKVFGMQVLVWGREGSRALAGGDRVHRNRYRHQLRRCPGP